MHFVANNFHRKALADRWTENRLGLRALDRLSNAHPIPVKKTLGKRGHRSPGSNFLSPRPTQNDNSSQTWDIQSEKDKPFLNKDRKSPKRRQKPKKAMASVIVDQVSYITILSAILLISSDVGRRCHRAGCPKRFQVQQRGRDWWFTFSAKTCTEIVQRFEQCLSAKISPSCRRYIRSNFFFYNSFANQDFYPYFRSTAEAVSPALW